MRVAVGGRRDVSSGVRSLDWVHRFTPHGFDARRSTVPESKMKKTMIRAALIGVLMGAAAAAHAQASPNR
jgi:hypothetical protein